MARSDQQEHDRKLTEINRDKLSANKNLLLWYEKLYRTQFSALDDIDRLVILEIGSGTSPLKLFYENVITSDIMELAYLDLVFDCHEIAQLNSIGDESVDIITFTNVLHHLSDPLLFLQKAAVKLKRGGRIIMTEPYYSLLSGVIYHFLHHEPSDFATDTPCHQRIQSPLSSANMAVPYILFFMERGWEKPLLDLYEFSGKSIKYFSAISYMATGGISRRIPLPHWFYKILLRLDLKLSAAFPRLCSSFFILTLTRK